MKSIFTAKTLSADFGRLTMNDTLEKQLYEKYPEFFENRKLDRSQSAMVYGISCDDGWYHLIDNACKIIQNYLINHRDIEFKFDQIKEKFAGLRLYYTGGNYKDFIAGVIESAENMSYQTCEITGQRGDGCRKGSWLKTLCPEKMQELGYELYKTPEEQQ